MEESTTYPVKKILLLGVVFSFLGGCCALPALLAIIGLGLGTGIASWFRMFDPYRPLFLGLTVLLFGYAFTRLYGKNSLCHTGENCLPSRQLGRQRQTYWFSLALSLLLIGIPWLRAFISNDIMISH